jgi:3-hydroxy-9,10-secoandrosta-1,3,5(10)-triene-9,17-dione monooxygenase
VSQARGFADVTYDEAMRRARELVPVLRERADAAEAARQMQKETLDDLHRTGLLRFHQPRPWGGMELPFVALFDVPAEVARGCASTGWNVANLGVHHWMLALYDERAQEEVWGGNPDVVIPSGIAYPQGRGRAVDGGLVISGHWNFSSGVDHGDWNMLAVMVRDGERVVDHRMCLVPRGDYEIVDDWHVLGMRSTGSKSVRATDVFVPEHRALSMYLARGGATFPGARVNPNPIYQVPLSALGSHCLAGAGVGNAQAALELTIEAIRERSTNYTAMRMRDFQAVQLRVAHAGAMVDLARLAIRTDCLEAERIARDQHALAAHIGFSWDAQAAPWALVAMGGEFSSPTM